MPDKRGNRRSEEAFGEYLVGLRFPKALVVPFLAFESTRLRQSHRRGTAILILSQRPVVRYSATR